MHVEKTTISATAMSKSMREWHEIATLSEDKRMNPTSTKLTHFVCNFRVDLE